MNKIKNNFSIIDLENLSGIKAHNIRIWEKRYQIFNPTRHGNNERLYDIDDLKKALNISFLQNNNWKISKIANLSVHEMELKVDEIVLKNGNCHEALNQFKVAMLSFDQNLFHQTYHKLLAQLSFREIFMEILVPFLDFIGMLWQTGTIIPAHEHFISQLIENKLHVNIEKIEQKNIDNTKTFVLFLPENEVHNLGLLYIQYELLLKGYHTIYLGPSIPIANLKVLQKLYHPIVFISQLTVAPSIEVIKEFVHSIQDDLLANSQDECWVSGRKAKSVLPYISAANFKPFLTIKELLNTI